MRRGCWAVLLALFSGVAAAAPEFSAVRAAHPSSDSRLLDRHGVLLQELRTDLTRHRGQWLALADISPRLRVAVIALEDHRFAAHSGVDWIALAGALRDKLRGSARGASTISMQVAAQIDPGLRTHGHRSWRQKLGQMAAARELEAHWSKNQILEAYLNLASFRGELEGIDSASRVLFEKSAAALDGSEALLLAALLQSPNAPAERVARRACGARERARISIDCAAIRALAMTRLREARSSLARAALAPQLAHRLLRGHPAIVHSSLDARLQQFARDSLQRQLRALGERNVHDGAVLVVDNASGEVLVYVGNGGILSSAPHVDGVRALRQAGSTLKPFLYGETIQTRLLTAASLLEDSPVNLTTPSGLYVPQNYDHSFKGTVSLRTSLSGSLNVPAVRTLMLIGPDALIDRLHAFGFANIDRDGDYYGYSLALGSPEVSLWQLVNAYRSLANAGRYSALRLVPAANSPAAKTDASTTALSAAASFIVGDILADADSRSVTFGFDSPLALPFWSAVKTGTSKQMRDNWCIGYTTRYTVGVWVGNFDGAPMWEVSGLTGAAPVWAEIMTHLHANDAPGAPVPPPEVERRAITFADALEAPRQEWFLRGTAVAEVAPATLERTAPRITYPGRDSTLVVDPDIPAARQRVFFTMRPARPGAHWLLDGSVVPGGMSAAWRPAPGAYTLSLVAADQSLLDTLHFVVRGDTGQK